MILDTHFLNFFYNLVIVFLNLKTNRNMFEAINK